ncbi:MAG: hypothetical protein VB100_14410 [Angelakisella sp.]|nr:hypothetical protein [Angelakisella sp.]
MDKEVNCIIKKGGLEGMTVLAKKTNAVFIVSEKHADKFLATKENPEVRKQIQLQAALLKQITRKKKD